MGFVIGDEGEWMDVPGRDVQAQTARTACYKGDFAI